MCQRLQTEFADLRWVDPWKIHLTLKFFGEIQENQVPSIRAALGHLAEKCHPFDIKVESMGVFSRHGLVRTLWIGIRDESENLLRCHDQCDRLLHPLGFTIEARRFFPHLTVARNRSPKQSDALRRAMEREVDLAVGIQAVTSIGLFQSTLTSNGPIYHLLSRHAFARNV